MIDSDIVKEYIKKINKYHHFFMLIIQDKKWELTKYQENEEEFKKIKFLIKELEDIKEISKILLK